MTKHYPEIAPKPDFPKLEEEVLALWEHEHTFEKSIARREGAREFVFYDGPPFANGLPHYGHVLQSYNKDTVGRYFTMRGRKVARRWGWDCHGLPPELKTEKELGISGKASIVKYGVEKFVEKCRKDVQAYVSEWKGIVGRLGRWVDMDGAYKTMDRPYSESVMWAFKELFEKGLVYEDFRVLPYSWAAETVLSNFEVNQNYKDKTDPAPTVKIPLANGMSALVWTTTPWTLPSNLMLAVNPKVKYSVFKTAGGELLLIASGRAAAYKKELAGAELVREMSGAELAGVGYTPLFPYFAGTEGAFQILAADFVGEDEGTGIVHLAPGFGEDDFAACRQFRADFPIICPVDGAGRFTAEVKDYAGLQVFDANDKIIEHMRREGRLFKKDQITHSYPFCWRTDKPLIYRATSSWFVKVSAIKDELIKANQGVNWIPAHVKDGRFGNWLEGARDWSISRNRFWGAPIPVWKSDTGKVAVVGSIEELERLSGAKAPDLHRPYIDQITWKADDGSVMRRVEDVFDCWFESGAMPFASVHYPFENKEWFERNFPADFISEAIEMTRGWFYTLAVLGVALFGKIPFKNCMATGLVFDEKGQKLSKKLGNYSEPSEFFDKYGSDAFRWLMLSSPLLKGEVAYISKEGEEIAAAARRTTLSLWNPFHFFTIYANADGIEAEYRRDSDEVLDRYILSKLAEFAAEGTAAMDRFDTAAFCRRAEAFLDALSNWYIRLSRERFWGTGVARESQQKAFNTLYVVMADLARLVAPLLPFTADYVYRALTGAESVHLEDWPEATERDGKLLEAMEAVRAVCTSAKAEREAAGIKIRQPLARLVVASKKADMLAPYADIIKVECNVEEVQFKEDVAAFADEAMFVFTPQAGRRLGARLAEVQRAVKAGEFPSALKLLLPEEYEMRLRLKPGVKGQATPDNSAVVMLDSTITPELKLKGELREFLRAVQEERKRLGLDVSDRIVLSYTGGLEPFHDEIARVALARVGIGKGKVPVPDSNILFTIKKA